MPSDDISHSDGRSPLARKRRREIDDFDRRSRALAIAQEVSSGMVGTVAEDLRRFVRRMCDSGTPCYVDDVEYVAEALGIDFPSPPVLAFLRGYVRERKFRTVLDPLASDASVIGSIIGAAENVSRLLISRPTLSPGTGDPDELGGLASLLQGVPSPSEGQVYPIRAAFALMIDEEVSASVARTLQQQAHLQPIPDLDLIIGNLSETDRDESLRLVRRRQVGEVHDYRVRDIVVRATEAEICGLMASTLLSDQGEAIFLVERGFFERGHRGVLESLDWLGLQLHALVWLSQDAAGSRTSAIVFLRKARAEAEGGHGARDSLFVGSLDIAFDPKLLGNVKHHNGADIPERGWVPGLPDWSAWAERLSESQSLLPDPCTAAFEASLDGAESETLDARVRSHTDFFEGLLITVTGAVMGLLVREPYWPRRWADYVRSAPNLPTKALKRPLTEPNVTQWCYLLDSMCLFVRASSHAPEPGLNLLLERLSRVARRVRKAYRSRNDFTHQGQQGEHLMRQFLDSLVVAVRDVRELLGDAFDNQQWSWVEGGDPASTDGLFGVQITLGDGDTWDVPLVRVRMLGGEAEHWYFFNGSDAPLQSAWSKDYLYRGCWVAYTGSPRITVADAKLGTLVAALESSLPRTHPSRN